MIRCEFDATKKDGDRSLQTQFFFLRSDFKGEFAPGNIILTVGMAIRNSLTSAMIGLL